MAWAELVTVFAIPFAREYNAPWLAGLLCVPPIAIGLFAGSRRQRGRRSVWRLMLWEAGVIAAIAGMLGLDRYLGTAAMALPLILVGGFGIPGALLGSIGRMTDDAVAVRRSSGAAI